MLAQGDGLCYTFRALSSYYCIAHHSKLSDVKITIFILLTDSYRGQEFGPNVVGTTCLCSTMSGASGGTVKDCR